MITIGLLSDTHDFLDAKLFEHFKNCDEIWHAGDIGSTRLAYELMAFKPLIAVHGNIDDKNLQYHFPAEQFLIREKLKIYINHYGGKPPKYDKRAVDALDSFKPDVFVCGHSHILRVIHDPQRSMLFVNPGAAGRHGFHKMRTACRFIIQHDKLTNFEVIELGLRAF